ncbi:hypothetical protein J5V48_05565 [Succinivibrio sp. AGMB01872]|uniref:Uncharacterized protein n=1 Tax=Succinivibrio faecicola TaxID=2820300 RepID=A0ABS7DGD4_9GAMM|nr:hypothetical protein [Succinivibrio faecicola]
MIDYINWYNADRY